MVADRHQHVVRVAISLIFIGRASIKLSESGSVWSLAHTLFGIGTDLPNHKLQKISLASAQKMKHFFSERDRSIRRTQFDLESWIRN